MTNPRLFQPILLSFIDWKQNIYLNDPQKRSEINEDLTFITLKVTVKNIIKILSLCIKLFAIVFFVGNVWFVIIHLQISHEETDDGSTHGKEVDVDFVSFMHNDKWSLEDDTDFRNLIVSMYFALTSLSTIGFGDFHPITSLERLVCSFLLLAGVTMFSIFMGDLGAMITQFLEMDGNGSDN